MKYRFGEDSRNSTSQVKLINVLLKILICLTKTQEL